MNILPYFFSYDIRRRQKDTRADYTRKMCNSISVPVKIHLDSSFVAVRSLAKTNCTFIELTWGITWELRMILRRWLRHGRRERYDANDRGADAASAVNPHAERRHRRIRDGQQHADAATVDAATPATDARHATEQQSDVVADADVTDVLRKFGQRSRNR